ncbi:MAG: AraC family transcriptional regulator ligand-binding domain-containing protein [Spongiibacteraceae bacterium]|jgi:AraC-like DNA-binding protein|nr:AraC family transcriptional regulator ligand-binding domain-containing protein [Spongiibacteraceae bacterium]
MSRTTLQASQADQLPLRALRALLQMLATRGQDMGAALERCGLSADLLHAPDDTLVSTLAYSKLYRYLMEQLQDEAFGMSSERAPPGTFRMMCLFVIHCRNLREALQRCARFFDFCDSFHHQQSRRRPIVERADGTVLCVFDRPTEEPGHGVADANMLFMMWRFFSWLVGRQLPIIAVQLRAAESAASAGLARLFPCPLHHRQAANGWVLARDQLNASVVQNEASLHDFLKTAPYPLISHHWRVDDQPFTLQVRQLLEQDLSRPLPGADVVAAALHISERTLHRQLHQESTRYQQLKDNVRRDAALAYLRRSDMSLNHIAILVGCGDHGTFHRAFKRWTGMTPGQYREKLARGDTPDTDHFDA